MDPALLYLRFPRNDATGEALAVPREPRCPGPKLGAPPGESSSAHHTMLASASAPLPMSAPPTAMACPVHFATLADPRGTYLQYGSPSNDLLQGLNGYHFFSNGEADWESREHDARKFPAVVEGDGKPRDALTQRHLACTPCLRNLPNDCVAVIHGSRLNQGIARSKN